MNIAYSVTVLANGLVTGGIDGIGHYSKELFSALHELNSIELIPFSFGFPVDNDVLGRQAFVLDSYRHQVIKGIIRPLSHKISKLSNKQVDLIHATDHVVPFEKQIPLVATVMDAILISHPEWVTHSRLGKFHLNLWQKIVKRADRILTISEYSKSEISHYFGIDPDRISVVPLGVDQRFFNTVSVNEMNTVLNKYNIEKPYFISIGTLQPRKNTERILDAIMLLPESIRKSYTLVIIGRYGWGSELLVEKIKKAEHEGWCKWFGYVPDCDLLALLQSSELLIFPSLCEGFGLPVLEAFASKVPVVASNTTSIPEVAGDAALLIDPLSSAAIATAITEIVENSALTEDLIKKGYQRAQSMTWLKCAEGTIRLYKEFVN